MTAGLGTFGKPSLTTSVYPLAIETAPRVVAPIAHGSKRTSDAQQLQEGRSMPELPKDAERRMVHRMLYHWREARGERRFPALIDMYEQPLGEMRASTFELRVGTPAGEPIFGLIGADLLGQPDVPRPGSRLSEIPPSCLVDAALRQYQVVIEKQAPVILGDSFVDRDGRSILFRSVVLPISEDGAIIETLLAAVNCRPIAD
jgi:hypothetical protein